MRPKLERLRKSEATMREMLHTATLNGQAYTRDNTDWMALNPRRAIAVTMRPLVVHNSAVIGDHPEVKTTRQLRHDCYNHGGRSMRKQSAAQKEDRMDEHNCHNGSCQQRVLSSLLFVMSYSVMRPV